ncbi:hypothetical protein [Ulvibacterium marinum]|nr:hypothetical protein [Ulvibacterium marinum]
MIKALTAGHLGKNIANSRDAVSSGRMTENPDKRDFQGLKCSI